MIHTEFRKGQRILIILKGGAHEGKQIVGKYVGKHRKAIEFEVGGTKNKMDYDLIRNVSIYRQKEM